MKKKKVKSEKAESISTESVSEITVEDMNRLLSELVDSVYWQAIRWLIASQVIMAKNNLTTIDIFKNPTLGARSQGVIEGLAGLEGYIFNENKLRKEDNGKDTLQE